MDPEREMVEGRLQGKFPPASMSRPKGKRKRKKSDEDDYE